MTIEKFTGEYVLGTVLTARGTRMRGDVELSLRPYTEGDVSVVVIDLICQRGTPKQGKASQVLDWLCSRADANKVVLYLSPVGARFLVPWYKRRGFAHVPHKYMRRIPR